MDVRWFAALAGALTLTGCTTQHAENVMIPTDGIHITGAINAIVPIAGGGTCAVQELPTGTRLGIFTSTSARQAYVGAIIENFAGPKTYTYAQPPAQSYWRLEVTQGARSWRAASGLISIKSFGGGKASGTLWATDLQEVNGTTRVNVAGSWTCRLQVVPTPQPSPSPSPSPPLVFPSPSPSPMGTPVARRILPPATVLPVVGLCSTPIQKYADGGAGPLFCGSGALIVEAWTYYVPVVPHLLSLGPNPTITAVESAFCADDRELHATNPMLRSGYEMAAAYYAWSVAFDPDTFILSGTCP